MRCIDRFVLPDGRGPKNAHFPDFPQFFFLFLNFQSLFLLLDKLQMPLFFPNLVLKRLPLKTPGFWMQNYLLRGCDLHRPPLVLGQNIIIKFDLESSGLKNSIILLKLSFLFKSLQKLTFLFWQAGLCPQVEWLLLQDSGVPFEAGFWLDSVKIRHGKSWEFHRLLTLIWTVASLFSLLWQASLSS